MTIAIAVQVHDGIVLASDSASTLFLHHPQKDPEIVNVYNHANKIFNLRKGAPIGGMTFGMGSIGVSSISTLAKDLRRRFSGEDKNHLDWKINLDAYSIEEIAVRAREFLYDECYTPLGLPPAPGVQFGFTVGGYSSGAQTSELWSISIENGQCAAPSNLITQNEAKAHAFGEPEVFSRIALGYSQKLGAALVNLGLNPADVPGALAQIRAETECVLVEAPMPIQDAVDLAEYLVHCTAMYTRFKRGAATVGGPIEIAAITKHEGFKWVRRKHYFSRTLNPTERDHEAGYE
ncbi:MAG: hypothetical protein AB7O04_07120 [Hyphomonadaceae bacterium]